MACVRPESAIDRQLRGLRAAGKLAILPGDMAERKNIAQVRGLWEATRTGGVEAALSLTDADVEWVPHVAGGRVFRTAELLAWLAEFEGDRHILDARPYSYREHGNQVLASGSFRLTGPSGSLSDHQAHWVFEFTGEGRLLRASSFRTAAEAATAAGLDAPEPVAEPAPAALDREDVRETG